MQPPLRRCSPTARATASIRRRRSSFTEGTGIGEWRPTNGVSDPFAWVAHVRPFTLLSTSQFRTAGPNPVNSRAYAREYAEVKALGAATGSSRTDEQTALASFYIPNPVEIFNRTFRTIATSKSLGSRSRHGSTRCSTSLAPTR